MCGFAGERSDDVAADVRVGVLVSGGLDSSLIVALLAPLGQHGLATPSIGGYSWYPSMAGARGLGTEEYAEVFFDRPHEDMTQFLADEHLVGEDVSRAFVEEHFARPGAETPLDRALRIDTEIMLAAAAAARRLLPDDVVDRPDEHRTNLDGSKLWQLGLLELWLQEQGL